MFDLSTRNQSNFDQVGSNNFVEESAQSVWTDICEIAEIKFHYPVSEINLLQLFQCVRERVFSHTLQYYATAIYMFES